MTAGYTTSCDTYRPYRIDRADPQQRLSRSFSNGFALVFRERGATPPTRSRRCRRLCMGGPAGLLDNIHATVTGVLLLAVHVWRTTQNSPSGSSTVRVRVSLALAVLCLMLAPAARAWHDSTWRANYRVENPIQAPLTMTEEGDGPTSPFFPSSATTTTGDIIPSDFFLTSKTSGRCHRDIYAQWNSSVHHFSSIKVARRMS